MVGERGFEPPTPLVPKKGLGCRAECFQSLAVVLRPSHFCSIIPVWTVCKPSNGNLTRDSSEQYLTKPSDPFSRERSGTVLPMKVGGKGSRTSLEWTGETLAT
jgi:hypothetical protein